MELSVRDCREDDLDALESALPSAGEHARQLANATAGRRDFLLALRAGEPVGTVVVRWAGVDRGLRDLGESVTEIGSLEVREDARGQGVGTALIAAAEERVLARGYTRAAILVADRNDVARRLYERIGYVDSGLRRKAAGGPWAGPDGTETSLVLLRELDG